MTFEKEMVHRATGRLTKIVMMVLILGPIVFLVFGEAVLHLWNWLMPMLFHLPQISFWQAWGLLVLSWLLFGGLRGSGPRSGYRRSWRHRVRDRWEQMTPEEREKFWEWMQSRCGSPAAEAQQKG